MSPKQQKTCQLERDLATFLALNQNMIADLKNLITETEVMEKDCKIAKVAGVTVAGVGSAVGVAGWIIGLALVPMTAGLSAVVASGLTIGGAAVAASGGLTVAGTHIVNGICSKKLLNKLTKLQKQREHVVEGIVKTFIKIDEMVAEMVKQGNKEDVAVAFVLYCLKYGEIDLDDVEASVAKLTSTINLYTNNHKCREDGKQNTIHAEQIGSGFARAAVTPAAAILDDVVIGLMRNASLVSGATVVRNVVRGVAAGIGVVFTIVDVVLLIRDWDKKNPIIPAIQNCLSLYEDEIMKFRPVLDILAQI